MEKARSEYVCELSKWLNIYLNGIKDQEAYRGSLGPFLKKNKKVARELSIHHILLVYN